MHIHKHRVGNNVIRASCRTHGDGPRTPPFNENLQPQL